MLTKNIILCVKSRDSFLANVINNDYTVYVHVHTQSHHILLYNFLFIKSSKIE